MQSASYPSEEKTQACVRQLFAILLPDQQFKSIHDLFNAQKFHRLFAALVNSMDEQHRHKLPEVRLSDDSQSQSYNQMKRKQFKMIADNMRSVEECLGITAKRPITDKEINKLVQRSSMGALHRFLQHFFEMIQFNKQLVHKITILDQEVQYSIFQMMQTYSSLPLENDLQDSEDEISTLKISSKINRHEMDQSQLAHLEEIQNQLQSHIQMREQEIRELKFGKEQVQEEVEELRKEMMVKNQQIEMLKKRLMSYEQIDQLMIQKDQQILKLTKKLADHQLKSRLKQSQLINQTRHLNQRLTQLQSKQIQIISKYQKQKQHIQLLNKQKDQSQTSMKKVIHNLKEKNKSFMDKINDLQKELIEANFEKEMKEKELGQLRMSVTQGNKKPMSTSVFDSLQSPRSPLKQDPNQQLGSVRGNYSKLGQQLSLDLDRADFQDQFGLLPKQNNKRFNQLLQQNYILKQQLHKIQSSNSLDSKQCKDLQDQVQKMKKKIAILKRRNDQIENQRKQEIDVMVGVMEWYAGQVQQGDKNNNGKK